MNRIHCRVCDKPIDDQTAIASVPHVPHDGDVGICLYCRTWSVYEGGELREPTPDEQDWIDTNPDCADAARVAIMFNLLRALQ
ncbi:hypothetical protein HDG32_005496 [Paraburkholderia sp. CI2]|uniref:hypothetical protein n=1 Tax=Paraburkholderia sp. CI2 TaxID=2723093 RepID=UPI00160B5709|nr:hypothetical protein [Paraburkholderia sp. CI2]MBB5469349.1 hypothetical protein [Paraburkholderia sp. CI2]